LVLSCQFCQNLPLQQRLEMLVLCSTRVMSIWWEALDKIQTAILTLIEQDGNITHFDRVPGCFQVFRSDRCQVLASLLISWVQLVSASAFIYFPDQLPLKFAFPLPSQARLQRL
jgi:hypothetical protein